MILRVALTSATDYQSIHTTGRGPAECHVKLDSGREKNGLSILFSNCKCLRAGWWIFNILNIFMEISLKSSSKIQQKKQKLFRMKAIMDQALPSQQYKLHELALRRSGLPTRLIIGTTDNVGTCLDADFYFNAVLRNLRVSKYQSKLHMVGIKS